MLRARCRAAQCVLDLTRRRSGGSGTAAVRVLADSSRQAPTAAGWIVIEHAPFHSAGATATAGAAAPVPAEGDSVQLGAENPEASEALGNSASSLEESELPTESQSSLQEELVSKLKAIRSGTGPGHLYQAKQMLIKARKGGVYDITAYNVVLRMIGMEQWMSKEMVKMVEDLMVMLKEDDLVPNVYTYNGVLFVYAQARSLPRAKRAYEEMLSNGIKPNVLTLSHLAMAQAWASSENIYRTLAEIDEKGWTPTRAAHICAIAYMWQRKDAEGVLKMMQSMHENKFQPTEAAFAMALMSAGRLGRTEFAKVLFEWRIASGLGPKQEIYSSMMLAHSKAGLHEESLGYWRQLVCLDGVGQVTIEPATCNSALKSAVVSNQWDEVETIADLLKGQAPVAAQHTYMLAIAACRARSGGDRPDYSERVERAVDAVRQMGTEPNPEVMCRVAMACVRGHKWERAAAIFEDSLARNVEMWAFRWECVIRTFLTLERFGDIKDAWKRINTTRGGKLTVVGNELAMRAAHQLRDGDWAKEIIALSAKNDPKKGVNPTTLQFAVELLAETGRMEEARALLKDWTPCATIRINHVDFNKLLLCCEQHIGSDVLLELYQALRQNDPVSRLGPSTFPSVTRAFCDQGRAREAVSLFEEHLTAGYQPEKACYEAVARAASEAGDAESSARFLEAAENAAPPSSAEDAAVAFEEGGQEHGIDSADIDSAGGGGEDVTVVQERHRPASATTAGCSGEEESPAATAASR